MRDTKTYFGGVEVLLQFLFYLANEVQSARYENQQFKLFVGGGGWGGYYYGRCVCVLRGGGDVLLLRSLLSEFVEFVGLFCCGFINFVLMSKRFCWSQVSVLS
ncbi:hypothetical protein T492DRAFT_348156 [Pavlovales sp. CCMP2436]|nr:hypothetical protein T492DRAFT_348156 [Pavlovales sp. CCMP2436]